MRPSSVLLVSAALALGSPAAQACDPVVTACLPAVVAFPAYTPEGLRVGTVVARVAQPMPLERSRSTGQPRTVVFNNPGSLPGSVDPGLTLVPLPRAKRFDTRGAYPRGY